MSLTLGKSFNRQIKLRLPFKDFFYDIGIFYHTDMNFNLFDIKPILKFNSDKSFTSIKINMFKNIETSEFCTNCLNVNYIDNRPSEFNSIKDIWQNDIYCDFKESVFINKDNYLKFYNFKIKSYKNNTDDFIFLLVERKNFLKKYKNDKIITVLSGIQITTSAPFEYISTEYQKQSQINYHNKDEIIKL